MTSRKRIPANLKDKLLVEANYACTICGRSSMQIHHIDGNSANNEEDNLIVLCLSHFDEAELSKTSKGLSANLPVATLREYKQRLKLGFSHAKAKFNHHQNKISADINDIKDSNIVIAGGDVTVHYPQSSVPAPLKSMTKTNDDRQSDLRERPTVGIITALAKEYAAVKALLENALEFKVSGHGAGRRYLLGEIPSVNSSKHFVVLSLAAMGNNIAATRATLLLEHFPNVDSIIMVGNAGGVPYPDKPDEHVRLGDIVISNQGGVVQYDFDKETANQISHRHPPRPPSSTLLEAVDLLKVAELEGSYPWLKFIEQAQAKLRVNRPAEKTDILINYVKENETILHPGDPKRRSEEPRVFTGVIASANKLLKNPLKRDALRDQFGIKAVEMEGSGIADASWNHEKSGYLIVRGICDYCDSNKNDVWQEYAAIVAAAYTRALIESMPALSNGNIFSIQVDDPILSKPKKSYSLTRRFSKDDTEDEDESPWSSIEVDLESYRSVDKNDVRYLRKAQRIAWQEELDTHKRNLNALELKKAKYWENVPPPLLEQIENEQNAIERLKTLMIQDKYQNH